MRNRGSAGGESADGRIREDKEVWEDYKRETREWDATLMDGLEED